MKHKLICLTLLALLAVMLWSDEVADKMRELERIQQELQEVESRVAVTESQKRQKEAEIANTLKIKRQTEQELRRIQTEAREKLTTLNTVKRELRTVGEQIQDLRSLQNAQLVGIIRSRHAHHATRFVPKEQRFLAFMATQTREKLNSLGDMQQTLTSVEHVRGREYAEIDRRVKTTSSTNKNLASRVYNLESEKSKLNREQQQLQNQIAKLRQDAAQLESLIAQLTSKSDQSSPSYRFSSRTISWPVRGRIIRRFGEETRSYGTSVISNGIDIEVDEWTPVIAADAGEIVFAGPYGGQGKLIIIDHKNGFFTVYAYNNEILVSLGSFVKKGQTIAKSGMTGSATVPSLHFEVRKDGKAVNPLLYLD
ncbi:MAG TPA: peptidoglycan DD-metalloendopeptidase family protein [Candidatus Syntrophosphaera sp.]|nr:peptidoglycan DD-metalloendopeptidase family protein [Candidatus Syntrophosphaera sp.]